MIHAVVESNRVADTPSLWQTELNYWVASCWTHKFYYVQLQDDRWEVLAWLDCLVQDKLELPNEKADSLIGWVIKAENMIFYPDLHQLKWKNIDLHY